MTITNRIMNILNKTAMSAVVAAILAAPQPFAQTAPDFTIEGPFLVTDAITREAGLAINIHEPEVLFVTYDTINQESFADPITGEVAAVALIGRFFSTETLEPTSEIFIILGNPNSDAMETVDVRYNPVSRQYVVIGKADGRSTAGANIPLVAIVNPVSAGGDVVRAFAIDEDSSVNYDDVALGCSTNNGNFLVVAERNMPETGDSEGAAGFLFDQDGNQLTPEFTRLDIAQIGTGNDVDDPDVDFLPNNNVFLYLHNTDSGNAAWQNRITGVVVEPVPGPDGQLVISDEQLLSENRIGQNQGHPAAIENPFSDELIGAFDYNNGAHGGDLFFFNVGDAPDYELTVSQDQTPYLTAAGDDPIRHRHPQLAADPDSGVIILAWNIDSSTIPGIGGMVFNLLGPDGQSLPGNGTELDGVGPFAAYLLDPTETATISNSANYHNVAYDAFTDSFIIVYATKDNFTRAARIVINSDHGGIDSAIEDGWMMY